MGTEDVPGAPNNARRRGRRAIDDCIWSELNDPKAAKPPQPLLDEPPQPVVKKPPPIIEPPPPPPVGERYVSGVPFEEEHPSTLAMHCSDGRFSEGVTGLVTDAGRHRFDVLAIPGGPALITMSSANLIEIETTRSALNFLVKGHKVDRIHLIAHEGCGFYRRRYVGAPPEKILKKQIDDLQLAAVWLRRVYPSIDVRLHLASPGGVRIVFTAVPVDLKREDPYGI